jgi:hypothetical protein
MMVEATRLTNCPEWSGRPLTCQQRMLAGEDGNEIRLSALKKKRLTRQFKLI